MPAPNDLERFFQELESEITDLSRAQSGSVASEFREGAFTELLVEELEELGVLESAVVCHFESGVGASSMKVSGYGVPDEDSRLDVAVTLYRGPADRCPTVNSGEIDAAFKKLERYLVNALDGLHARLEPGHDHCRMAERISGCRGTIDRVNLFLLTNAKLAMRREARRQATIGGFPAAYEVWDIERLRRLRESGSRHEALNVDLSGQPGGGLAAVRLDTGEKGFRTWVTAFPGVLLSELYGEYGSRLLELNVRSYLQARGKVNKGILETLRLRPEDFMAYNNGITVVAEEVITGDSDSVPHRIVELRGMQIVNGGQTTASIYRAARDFQADLTKVFVQAKVTIVEPARFQEVVPLISQYSNTQNKVSTADLSANHVFHVGLERVSRRDWSPDQRTQWFYERARGSYQTAKALDGVTEAKRRQFEQRYPAHQRFTKEDLARFENAWRGEPHWVSRGAQKNFVHFMERVGDLPDGWEPTSDEFHRYVARGILFREVQRIVRSLESITAYRINVTAYTTALLAEKTARRIDLDRIWREQRVSDAVRGTVEAWAPVVFTQLPQPAQQAGRHVDESFKREETWNYVRNLDLKVPETLLSELCSAVDDTGRNVGPGRSGRQGKLTDEDHNNIALCKELSQAQWTAIADWGQASAELAEWQRGIARTLAGYAAEGWSRAPSHKQAKYGAAMIEAARRGGTL